MITSKSIETFSTTKVETTVEKTGYIDTYISKNDKEPFVDGHFYLYKNAQKTKDCFLGKAYVQIKGKVDNRDKLEDSIMYPIEINDLKSYAKYGVLFFVVIINEFEKEAKQIYYVNLEPYRVSKIIKENTNKTTKSISLKKFPEDCNEIIEIILNFIEECKKQLSFIEKEKETTIESLKKNGAFDGLSFQYIGVGKKKDILSLLNGKNITLYANIKNTDLSIPVEYIEDIEFASSYEKNEDICINNKVYYKKYLMTKESNKISIKIDDFFLMTDEKIANKKTKRSITLKVCGDLDDRIKQIYFIKDLVKFKKFSIGKSYFSVTITENDLTSINYNSFDNYINDFNDFKFVLNALSVTKELDVSKCNQKEVNNLRALVKGIKLNELITINDDIHPISYIKVADISLLLAFQQFEEDKYKIINFFGEKLDFVAGDNKEPVSQFVILTEKDFLKADNINYEYITKDIASCKKSQTYMVNLNNLLLEMLKAYDKNQSNGLLSLINFVDNILINEPQLFDSEIAKINHIQTIARQRKLSFEEKSFLFQLINSKDNSEENKMKKFCACSLLGEHNKAKEYFDKLDSNDKESVRNYPIMKFYCPE